MLVDLAIDEGVPLSFSLDTNRAQLSEMSCQPEIGRASTARELLKLPQDTLIRRDEEEMPVSTVRRKLPNGSRGLPYAFTLQPGLLFLCPP